MRFVNMIKEEQKEEAVKFVGKVFLDSEDEKASNLVMNLIREIRSKKYYVPELEIVMSDEKNNIIGYCMFSRFHIEGKYDNELLLLSPVAVKTELQRQHISKEIIEYGFNKAIELGFKVCIVEGNPLNYRSRGFVTSKDYNINASESVGLPAPECLMVKELVKGSLEKMSGYINYEMYDSLR